MARINWAMYVHTLPACLCVGEEKALTDVEIAEINKLVGDIFQDSCRLDELFKRGRDRFATPRTRPAWTKAKTNG